MTPDRQRIDKWLWHARVVRTRTAAAGLATAGHVRLNGARIDAPSRAVKAGDVVTVALDGGVRVLRVVGFAPRRGSAEMARTLFEEEGRPVADPAPLPEAGFRPAGSGRPTKRDRRTIDRFRREEP